MAVTKINGFAAPYKSKTFQQQTHAVLQQSGLLSISGKITSIGGSFLIPPLEFVQNGLLVQNTSSKTILEPTLEAPYYLIVSSPSTSNTDDLIYTFIKSREELTDTSVIIAYNEGVEWLYPKLISNQSILNNIKESNLFHTNNIQGLTLSHEGNSGFDGHFVLTNGKLITNTGEQITYEEEVSFPEVLQDNDYNRIDRVVFRQTDSFGERLFLVGNTFAPSITALYSNNFFDSGNVNQKTQSVVAGNSNEIFLLSSYGYGDVFSLQIAKVSSNRQSLILAPTIIAEDLASTHFHAVFDSDNNFLYIVYSTKIGVKLATKLLHIDILGNKFNETVVHEHHLNSVINPVCCYANNSNILYVVDYTDLTPNNNLYLYTLQATSGNILSSPQIIGYYNCLYKNTQITLTSDMVLCLIVEDAVTKQVQLIIHQISNFEEVFYLPETLYNNVAIYGEQKNPSIILCSNYLIITFLQNKGNDKYGICFNYISRANYWSSLALQQSFLLPIISSQDNISTYDICADSIKNGLYILLNETTAGTVYCKIEYQTLLFQTIVIPTQSHNTNIVRDSLGSIYQSYITSLSQNFISFATNIQVTALGNIEFGVNINEKITLLANELLIEQNLLPQIQTGNQLVITGADVLNNGTYLITEMPVQISIDSILFYHIKVNQNFDHGETIYTNTFIVTDVQKPEGNGIIHYKTNAELSALAYRKDVLDTDVLLARINGVSVLNYHFNENLNNHIICYGNAIYFKWIGNILTIEHSFSIVDLLNNLTYTIAPNVYSLNNNEVIYTILDSTDFSPLLSISSPNLIPYDQNVVILGYVENNKFIKAPILSNLKTDKNTLIIGNNLGNPGDYVTFEDAYIDAIDGSKIIITEDIIITHFLSIDKKIEIECINEAKIHFQLAGQTTTSCVLFFNNYVKTRNLTIQISNVEANNAVQFDGVDNHHSNLKLILDNATLTYVYLISTNAKCLYLDGVLTNNAIINTEIISNISDNSHDVVIRDSHLGVTYDLFNRLPPIQEILVGDINGINNSFELSQTPATPQSVLVMRDSLPLIYGVHFSITNKTVIFVSEFIPQLGQQVHAYYLPSGLISTALPTINLENITTDIKPDISGLHSIGSLNKTWKEIYLSDSQTTQKWKLSVNNGTLLLTEVI